VFKNSNVSNNLFYQRVYSTTHLLQKAQINAVIENLYFAVQLLRHTTV